MATTYFFFKFYSLTKTSHAQNHNLETTIQATILSTQLDKHFLKCSPGSRTVVDRKAVCFAAVPG